MTKVVITCMWSAVVGARIKIQYSIRVMIKSFENIINFIVCII